MLLALGPQVSLDIMSHPKKKKKRDKKKKLHTL